MIAQCPAAPGFATAMLQALPTPSRSPLGTVGLPVGSLLNGIRPSGPLAADIFAHIGSWATYSPPQPHNEAGLSQPYSAPLTLITDRKRGIETTQAELGEVILDPPSEVLQASTAAWNLSSQTTNVNCIDLWSSADGLNRLCLAASPWCPLKIQFGRICNCEVRFTAE